MTEEAAGGGDEDFSDDEGDVILEGSPVHGGQVVMP